MGEASNLGGKFPHKGPEINTAREVPNPGHSRSHYTKRLDGQHLCSVAKLSGIVAGYYITEILIPK